MQRIEAQNVANSGWNYGSATSYVTLSFWIRSSVSQAFIVRFRSEDGTLQNYPMSTGTLTADTWTKITKTIPGNSNVTINNDNGAGLRVEFAAFWGTNYTDSGVSLDTWAAYSASTRAPDMTSTWAATTNATFDIPGVQLEVGTVATPFEHRSYGDELARCIRYYRRLNSDTQSDIYTGYGVGVCNASTRMLWTTMLSPPMRSHPAVSGTAQRIYDGSNSLSVTSFATNRSSTNALWIEPTASSGTITIGRAVLVGNDNDATGYIELSAEL